MSHLFLTNRSERTFLSEIKAALKSCFYFRFSVSFIKKAGLVLLEQDIENALKRGAKGQIITSGYQNFTDVGSLRKFEEWAKNYPENFSSHFDFDSFGDDGFHCKGYLFEFIDHFEYIIGSSNITRFALLKNIEWNISVIEIKEFSTYREILDEFNKLRSATYEIDESIIAKYEIRLRYAVERWDMDYISSLSDNSLRPNLMQSKALKEIRRYRDMGADKALIVAATGSGKTILAAFDSLNYGAKRLLYVVHREVILEEARKAFIKVYKGRKTSFGLFTGNKQELDSDFIFATNNELARHLDCFEAKEFDYIIMDECHHTAANTYKKIIEHFKPGFMLGLTATPNRTDAQDILNIFDENVPYQLSIADALNSDLIVPFKYFAVRDPMVDYSLDKKDSERMIEQILDPDNCILIYNSIKEHLPKGKLKCIGFCRSVNHAMRMSQRMNEQGINSTYLSGNSDTGARLKAFDDLSSDSNPLEAIFTVDILNEGIDIPAINMVLFLRPTQSQIVFLQQLGRGLRKYPNKDFLTVLDFIGNNYERSYQIALALSSLKPSSVIEKPELREMVRSDFSDLGLPVEIHLDEKSKSEILKYIEKTNFNKKEFLINDYKKFKEYLGNISGFPKQSDFLDRQYAPDLLRIINASMDGTKNGSYYGFLSKIQEDNLPYFSKEQRLLLEDLSAILPLVRPDDYAILASLIEGDKTFNELEKAIEVYGSFFRKQYDNAIKFLSGRLLSSEKYATRKLLVRENNGIFSFDLSGCSSEFIEFLKDLLNYGLQRFLSDYGERRSDFILYANYSTAQFMMCLDENYTNYAKGTKIEGETGYILVGLKKDESIDERLNYKDRFLSDELFQRESETGSTFNSTKGRKVLSLKTVHLFVRKVKSEDGITLPYTYFGSGRILNPRESNNPGKTLLFDIILDNKVPEQYRNDFLIPSLEEVKL